MKYIIDIPDGRKPTDMLNWNCDTDDAVKMLMSAVPVEDVTTKLQGNTVLAEQGRLYFTSSTVPVPVEETEGCGTCRYDGDPETSGAMCEECSRSHMDCYEAKK